MLNFILIGFMIQFVRLVQCLDAANTDKLIFAHTVNKQTVRLIPFQIQQLKFSENFVFKQTAMSPCS